MVPRFRTEFSSVRWAAIRAAQNSTDKYVPRRAMGSEPPSLQGTVAHWKSREESEFYSEVAYGPHMQAIYGITRAQLLRHRDPDWSRGILPPVLSNCHCFDGIFFGFSLNALWYVCNGCCVSETDCPTALRSVY